MRAVRNGNVPCVSREGPSTRTLVRVFATFAGLSAFLYLLTAKLKRQAAALPHRLTEAATTLSSITVGVFSTFVQLITVLTIAFFLLLDGDRALVWALDLLPPERAERTRGLAERIYAAI